MLLPTLVKQLLKLKPANKALKKLHADLKQSPADTEVAAYVQFRLMAAEYTVNLQKAGPNDYEKIQQESPMYDALYAWCQSRVASLR